MSYYANAEGKIKVEKKLTDGEKAQVRTILDYFTCGSIVGGEITLYHGQDNYDEDYVKEELLDLANFLAVRNNPIVSAEIEWRGEDGEIWRFVCYNGEWAEQNGYIEWGDEHSF